MAPRVRRARAPGVPRSGQEPGFTEDAYLILPQAVPVAPVSRLANRTNLLVTRQPVEPMRGEDLSNRSFGRDLVSPGPAANPGQSRHRLHSAERSLGRRDGAHATLSGGRCASGMAAAGRSSRCSGASHTGHTPSPISRAALESTAAQPGHVMTSDIATDSP